MFKQRSDAERNVLHLVYTNEVTTTDLAGHRRAAIDAARDLGHPFTIVNDLTECTTLSSTAAEELGETVRHLVPFGLQQELRVVSEETGPTVVPAFDHRQDEIAVDVVTVSSPETVSSALDGYLEQARS
jgi:hypothetical protein